MSFHKIFYNNKSTKIINTRTSKMHVIHFVVHIIESVIDEKDGVLCISRELSS